MGSGNLIINVNGKKVDITPSAVKSIASNPTTYGSNAGALSGGTFIDAGSLSRAGIPTDVGTIFKDKSGKQWKIAGQGYYGNIPVVKAGFGLKKVDPNKLTIVGDRGMEAL